MIWLALETAAVTIAFVVTSLIMNPEWNVSDTLLGAVICTVLYATLRGGPSLYRRKQK